LYLSFGKKVGYLVRALVDQKAPLRRTEGRGEPCRAEGRVSTGLSRKEEEEGGGRREIRGYRS